MPSLPPIRPEDEVAAERAGHDGHFDAPAEDTGDDALFDYLLRLGDHTYCSAACDAMEF